MNIKSIIQDIRSWGSGARVDTVTSDLPAPLSPDALAHRGAGFGEKTLSPWEAFPQSADSDILRDKPTLDARTRDLVRNNGFAAGAMQRQSDHIIGPRGLRLSARPDWRALGQSEKWATKFAEQAESLWESWANDPRECDVAGLLDMADHTTIAFKGCFANGDSFGIPLWRPEPGRKWALRIQGIEGDRVKNPQNQINAANIRGGIELDRYGKPIAYHVTKTHPGDTSMLINLSDAYATERIPAETEWGRRRVIHLIERQRYGQTRAVGALSAVIAQFKQLDSYLDYEMKNQMLNTMIGMVLETPLEDLIGLFANPEQAIEVLGLRKPPTFNGGGQVLQLKPGEKMSPYSPNRPGSQLIPFVRTFQSELCAATNLPYEQFTLDFSQSSYVGIRAGIAELYRFVNGKRYWVGTGWNQRWYELLMEEAVNTGRIDAPDFYSNTAAYCRADWIGAGQGYTDRTKEVAAAALAIKNRLSTLEIECAAQGLYWRDVIDQVSREEQYAKDKGVSLETDPAQVAAAGAPQVAPSNDAPPPPAPAPSPTPTKSD